MSDLASLSTPSERQPAGTLLLRTLAMPADTNPSGDIFGGWLMAQMDMGGAILAKELARGRVVTVAVDAITFLKPVAVGDVVCCYGQCVKVGNSSIKIKLETWVNGSRRWPVSPLANVTVSPRPPLPMWLWILMVGHAPCLPS